MQPLDLLTDEDKELIKQYSISYASVEPSSIEEVLSLWNKNKKKLLKIFNNQLRISIPIEVQTNTQSMYNRYKKIYSPLYGALYELQSFKADPRNHEFMNTLGVWLSKRVTEENIDDYRTLVSLIRYDNIEQGKISFSYTFSDGDRKKLKIQSGTKTMRAIRKVLEYYNFPCMHSFEKWRDDLSLVCTDKYIKSELVFSIHPIDFMTMSDNASGWSSCMSWIDHGGYSTGTIEMMNSNLAVVVYLKSQNSKIKFVFNNFEIPNKTWRTLLFVHKDILLVGKQYPYYSEVLAKTILEEFQTILKNNVGWTYQYKQQPYRDMLHSFDNRYVKYDLGREKNKHKIFVYTNIMYNDIIEDHCTRYWCCRNYVKDSLYLNLSGQATCMCCGEVIDEDRLDDISTSDKFCPRCFSKYGCSDCHTVSKNNLYYKVKVKTFYGSTNKVLCLSCLQNDYLFDIETSLFVHKYKVDKKVLSFKDRYKYVTMNLLEDYLTNS